MRRLMVIEEHSSALSLLSKAGSPLESVAVIKATMSN